MFDFVAHREGPSTPIWVDCESVEGQTSDEDAEDVTDGKEVSAEGQSAPCRHSEKLLGSPKLVIGHSKRFERVQEPPHAKEVPAEGDAGDVCGLQDIS